MKFVALVSGGKDSCHAMALAKIHGGHEVVALANLLPQEGAPDELDSYMYQTVGHQLVESYTSCMGVPLFRHRIRGSSKHQDLQYTQTLGDEVEDLTVLLAYIKATLPGVTAVSSGAIASDYQRLRVEHVCARLGLVSLAYMWHMPQRTLLRGMIDSQLHAIFVKVAALGLDPHKHLGKSITQLQHTLHRLNSLFGSNVCGEGGEYETLTLDCPAFKLGRIVLDDFEVVICSKGSIAQVGYLHPTKFHVEPKDSEEAAATVQPSLRPEVHMVPCDWSPPFLSTTEQRSEMPSQTACSSGGAYDAVLQTLAPSNEEYTQISGWAVERDCVTPASDVTADQSCLALKAVLQALVHALSEEGLSLHHAIFVHLHVCNMAHFGDVNAVYSQFFAAANPPSRACVQLPLPDGVPVNVTVVLARHAYLGPSPNPATLRPSHQKTSSSAPADTLGNTAASPLAAAAASAAAGAGGVGGAAPVTGDAHTLLAAAGAGDKHTAPAAAGAGDRHTTPAAAGAGDMQASLAANGEGPSAPAAGDMESREGEQIFEFAPTRSLQDEIQRYAEPSAQPCWERRVLHVQSISSWAPSCIGPYSQANTFRSITHIAGAIPLYPATMAVLSPEPHLQTLLAAANAQAVAIATGGCMHSACLSSIVYLSSAADVNAKEVIKRVMCDIHKAGLPPAHKLHDFFEKVASGQASQPPAEAVAALLGQHQASNEEEGEEEEEEEGQPDPYLCQPQSLGLRVMPGHLVFVEVPALPKSCLVEVQPTVLDVRWLQNRAANRARSYSTSSSSSVDPHPDDAASEEGNMEEWEEFEARQAARRKRREAASMQVNETSVQGVGGHNGQQQQHHEYGHGGQEPGSESAVGKCGGVCVPSSSSSSSGRGIVCLSSRGLYQGAAITLLLGITADAFDQAVDPTHCQLRHKILAALDQHGAGMQHIVQIRAWYDVTQVALSSAQGLQSNMPTDFSLSWSPVVGLCTSGNLKSAAAVVEVIAQLI